MPQHTAIPKHLWARIAKMAEEGWTTGELRTWLAENHGLDVSVDTVRRTVARGTSPAAAAAEAKDLLRNYVIAGEVSAALRSALVACLNKLRSLAERITEPKDIGDIIRAVQVLGELDIAKLVLGGDTDGSDQDPGSDQDAAKAGSGTTEAAPKN